MLYGSIDVRARIHTHTHTPILPIKMYHIETEVLKNIW